MVKGTVVVDNLVRRLHDMVYSLGMSYKELLESARRAPFAFTAQVQL